MLKCIQKMCPAFKEQKRTICKLWAECDLKKLGEFDQDSENDEIESENEQIKKRKRKLKEPLETEYVPLEEEEQAKLFEWCSWNRIEMAHVQNEKRCSKAYGAQKKREGVRKGFPDNIIPYAKGRYHGLFIELKRKDKKLSEVSKEQVEWQKILRQQGYACEICYGADQAIECIQEYMALKPKKD